MTSDNTHTATFHFIARPEMWDPSRAVCRIQRHHTLGTAIETVFEEWHIDCHCYVCVLRTASCRYTDPATWTRVEPTATMKTLALASEDFAIDVLDNPAAVPCARCAVRKGLPGSLAPGVP